MALHINIDDPKLAYTAGDIIKGRVVLHSSKEEDVGNVFIVFQGRTKTKIRKRRGNTTHTYRGRGNFFNFSQNLYQGHYTLRADRYEWPFQFQLPTVTQSRINEDAFDSSPPFRGNADAHQLPPTFSHTGRGFATNFNAFTEYRLEATLRRPPQTSKFFSSSLESSLNINCLPMRQSQQPDPQIKLHQQYFTASTLRLLPEKADAKLTMKEKMRSTFKSHELPKVSFHVMFTYPTQVYPGGDFPLKIGVRYGPQSEDIPEKPPIILNYVNVNVKTYISVRAPGVFGDHHDNDSKMKPILIRGAYNVPLPAVESPGSGYPSQGQWFDVGEVLRERRLVVPPLQIDFNTYNIATYNRVEIKIGVTCADKQFSFGTTMPMRVLPPTVGNPEISTPTSLALGGPAQVAATAGPRIDVSDAGPSDPLPPPPYIPAPTYDSLESEIPVKKG
jgi:hypothetical protein